MIDNQMESCHEIVDDKILFTTNSYEIDNQIPSAQSFNKTILDDQNDCMCKLNKKRIC